MQLVQYCTRNDKMGETERQDRYGATDEGWEGEIRERERERERERR